MILAIMCYDKEFNCSFFIYFFLFAEYQMAQKQLADIQEGDC